MLAARHIIYDEEKRPCSTETGNHLDHQSATSETLNHSHCNESTNIELFYDLFLVANLTTFTDMLNIDGIDPLKSYAGFFCILWFLWLQVSLCDVRFITSNVLDKLCMAAQFGVMISLALISPHIRSPHHTSSTFRSLAMTLMLSRLLLALRYLLVLRQTPDHPNSRRPLTLIVSLYFLAAVIFLGSFLAFQHTAVKDYVYLTWHIVSLLETAINVTISAHYRILSFQGTHLIHRMSLLTLIILGEGIIRLCKSCATIVENEASFTPPIIGTIVSSIAIIYLIYILYFEWMKPENYIVIRGDVWMVLHFPFHLALILLVEGAAQFILWRKVVEIFGVINGDFTKARKSPTVGTNLEVSELYSNLTNKIFNTYPPKFVRTIKEAQTVFHNIRNSSFGSPSQTKEVDTLFRIIQDSIFCNFDIEAPIIDRSLLKDPDEEWKGNINTFMLVFIYFFIASGITLMMLSLLKATIQPNLDKRNLIRIAIHCMCGIVLAALASSIKTGVGLIYAQSTWVLPTVALSFAFAMALTHIPMPY